VNFFLRILEKFYLERLLLLRLSHPPGASFSKISLRMNLPYKIPVELTFEKFCLPHLCHPPEANFLKVGIATHCNTLQHTAAHCITLQHTAAHCSTLQHTAAHCRTLQHTAAQFNTPPHTATHCNTLTRLSVAGCCSQLATQLTITIDYRADFREFVCFSMLQCVAVCCSVLQCVAVCCSVLQCVVN